jgi:integrase
LRSSAGNNSVKTDVKIRNEMLVNGGDGNNSDQTERNPLFDQKLDIATEGLEPYYLEHLKTRISKENALTIANYVFSMKVETNLSINHKRGIITSLKLLSEFLENRSFDKMTREDILLFLDNLRKPEDADHMHKWIGTYNHRLIDFLRFFKWLYFHNMEPSKRKKPEVVDNIPTLKRKEKSVYKPSDLWTSEEHRIFLQYCGNNKRDICYHAMAIDSSCRIHELLKIRIKDILYKTTNNYQYAEVLINGKTGSRVIPLFNSIPYIKDWLDDHPQRANPNAYIFCGLKKNIGRILTRYAIYDIYQHYKEKVFPRLLEDPNVPSGDKDKICNLLQKPFNPYIQRHYALSEKAKILKESVLRVHAGWGMNSRMPQVYLHYFGNESSESLLEAYGIVTKDQQLTAILKPKPCPNCNEANKPDAKFCAKCRMALTYDAYNETIQIEQQKKDKLVAMEERFNTIQSQMQALITTLGNMDETSKNSFAKQLFQAGIYKKDAHGS